MIAPVCFERMIIEQMLATAGLVPEVAEASTPKNAWEQEQLDKLEEISIVASTSEFEEVRTYALRLIEKIDEVRARG